MRLFAGIDIGGTNIKYGVIEEEGNIIKSSERSTEAHKGGMSIIDKVKEIIREMNKEYKIEGICVSTAGMVCPKEGKIVYAGPTIPNYTGVEIKKIIEKEFNIKCEVENDVNCAALGELWLGAGKGKKSMACMTIGTGIGGAIIVDGKIIHGFSNSAGKGKKSMACMTIGTGIGGAIIVDGKIIHGFSNSAGEIGYMLVNGEQIQNIASTTALVRNVAHRKGINENDINGKEIFKGYENGDVVCKEEIKKVADILALGISNTVYLFNPEVVVLGGGIMAREDILRPLIDKSLKKYLIESVYKNTNIAFAELKNTAGMMGAVYNYKTKGLM